MSQDPEALLEIFTRIHELTEHALFDAPISPEPCEHDYVWPPDNEHISYGTHLICTKCGSVLAFRDLRNEQT